MSGAVEAIFTSAAPAGPMRSIAEAAVEAGRGIVGDRYHRRVGTFSKQLEGKPDSELTLIEAEEIEHFNATHRMALGLGDPRRNIVTRGVRLNDLVGHRFRIGDVVAEGIRLCEPCAHLAAIVTPAVLPGLVHRAGLRARVISGGTIRPGDAVAVAT